MIYLRSVFGCILDFAGKPPNLHQNHAAQLTAPATGVYYVGLSSYPDTIYDPTLASSGTNASYTGN